MKISVAIPTYNSSATITATLQSVLCQTIAPDEIIVLDDGSTDGTVRIVNEYGTGVVLLQQRNAGVAAARNALCKRVTGDLVAFLDHDDIWHPTYLEVQKKLFQQYPSAGAFFTGHVNFVGFGGYDWNENSTVSVSEVETMDSLNFLRWYNRATGRFGSMSYCCIPRSIFAQLDSEPFRISGVDDSYLCSTLPLLGRNVIYSGRPLVAYRITGQAQSADRLKSFGKWVEVFELLDDRYRETHDFELLRAFELAFATKRRSYGKLLMGADRISEAREQLWRSIQNTSDIGSRAKSATLLASTYLPTSLQPMWPEPLRMNDV